MASPSRMRLGIGLASTITVLLAGCGGCMPTASGDPGRVGVLGSSLRLNGSPWWPVGMNAYQLGTDWEINVGCGAEVDLDAYFGSLPPNTLTRFNAYLSFATNKSTGELDFAPLDAVFETAARHDQLLNAVLSSSEGACENSGFKDSAWFADGWRSDVPPDAPMSYAQWVDTAVRRWADSPAAAAWTPVGEPEPSNCGPAGCDWRARECPAGAAEILRQFVDEVGGRIRQMDPDALLWDGRAGGGQCGSVGDDYAYVAASPWLDVLEYHAHEFDYELPVDPNNGLGRRIRQARMLDKPLVVSELGLGTGSCRPMARRHDLVAPTLTELRKVGVAGVLFWAFVPDPRPDECTYDIGPYDALMELLGNGA